MTVLESLACGIPVVSVMYDNFEDGVLINDYNGLLVKNNDIEALAEGLNRFIEDEKLYLSCKENTRNSVESFSLNAIAAQWKELIENK